MSGTAMPLNYAGLAIATSPNQIEVLRNPGRKIWMLYSFPREFKLRSPDLFRYIRTQLSPVAVFRGTLGGGDLYIAITPQTERR